MFLLNPNHFFGEGTDQWCFLHPEDEHKCIKISKQPIKDSRLCKELRYTMKLQKRNTEKYAYPFYAQFLECVETNLGKGFVFDLIRDEDSGEISKTYEYYLMENQTVFDDQELKVAFDLLIEQMAKHKVIAHDIGISNICCKIDKEGSLQMILIDGLGHRDFLPLVDRFSYFAKNKILRRIHKIQLQTPKRQRAYQYSLEDGR